MFVLRCISWLLLCVHLCLLFALIMVGLIGLVLRACVGIRFCLLLVPTLLCYCFITFAVGVLLLGWFWVVVFTVYLDWLVFVILASVLIVVARLCWLGVLAYWFFALVASFVLYLEILVIELFACHCLLLFGTFSVYVLCLNLLWLLVYVGLFCLNFWLELLTS